MSRLDESDRLRDQQILWLRREVWVWRSLAVVGMLIAMGPQALSIWSAVTSIIGGP